MVSKYANIGQMAFAQIKVFWEYSSGFGHLLMPGQAGFLTRGETTRPMELFAKEVYPRLKELTRATKKQGRSE